MGMGVAQLFRRPLGLGCYTDKMIDSRAPTTTNDLKSLHIIASCLSHISVYRISDGGVTSYLATP